MKKAVFCLILLCAFLFSSCLGGTPQADYFAVFSTPFEAELNGSFRGMPFAARLTVGEKGDSDVREASLLFYEPPSLAGVCVSRTREGVLTLCAGELSLPAETAQGFSALLELFPTSGEIQEVSLEGDLTHVRGNGFSLAFYSDGMPALAENSAVNAKVISFKKEQHPTP